MLGECKSGKQLPIQLDLPNKTALSFDVIIEPLWHVNLEPQLNNLVKSMRQKRNPGDPFTSPYFTRLWGQEFHRIPARASPSPPGLAAQLPSSSACASRAAGSSPLARREPLPERRVEPGVPGVSERLAKRRRGEDEESLGGVVLGQKKGQTWRKWWVNCRIIETGDVNDPFEWGSCLEFFFNDVLNRQVIRGVQEI